MSKVEIYDTTLRDGSQMRGICFSLDDKIKIIEALVSMGVDFIEAGWPGTNNTDTELFRTLSGMDTGYSVVCAFGMTCRKGKKPSQDRNLGNLCSAEAKVVTLVGKSWDKQVEIVLNATLSENLRMIKESCCFLTQAGKDVFFDAEHFFDGYKDNPDYALATLKAAARGGAKRIILCDTNGGTIPERIKEVVEAVKRENIALLGIHAHNDAELAVANTLAAVSAGAIHVQGTINGYGERSGNANLCSIIPTLQLKMGIDCLNGSDLTGLVHISHLIAEIANMAPDPCQPYVGANAFAHKAGMHGHAMQKDNRSYEHINPILVGNRSEIIISVLAGRGNVLAKARDFGITLAEAQIAEVLKQIKELESRGAIFEGADGSLELIMRSVRDGKQYPFEVCSFDVTISNATKQLTSEAIVRVLINGQMVRRVADGNGPINALDISLRKALSDFYPILEKVRLSDYKVRISNRKTGTDARVRVLIEFSDDKESWTTSGSSTDIVEASLDALVQGLELAIIRASN
ncbi:citramalate synthase [Patescibacteria group bacterium]|nr:citramalate synthase [Patescibacteria group bacterium]